MIEAKKLKTIAFDLDTKALQEHYKNGDWHNAYKHCEYCLNVTHGDC